VADSFCKDCKSFIDEPYPRCTTHVDMIRGEPLLCAVARGSEMHCGDSGKSWEEKEQTVRMDAKSMTDRVNLDNMLTNQPGGRYAQDHGLGFFEHRDGVKHGSQNS
jgi:hypothetical protein